ncbi:TIGR04282 family arsenosugar biosynthesis glycosyltransferase [Halomonas sp. THAF12]|uniref:TIGR04282 family arsenosugar biosynthesis glycosyltransferase n=1 Tax=Halomonas sp. B23F22_10 TaxID=3459515 RepID=UPI00373E81E5
MHAEPPRIAVLAKAPLPGRVKTRLIPALGAAGAAALHEHLLRRTLAVAIAASSVDRLTLWTALHHDHPLFVELAETHGIALSPQPAGDLGRRMHHALAAEAGPGLVVGSDCPALTPTLLRDCWVALETAEAVCLPAEDGGYGLIGARESDPALFAGIDWGGERVMAQTRARASALNWRLACPARVWDLDRPSDLVRFAARDEDGC